MRDYLAAYLRRTLAPTAVQSGVIAERATPTQLPKLTKPNQDWPQLGSVSFVSPLPRTYPENRRARPTTKRKAWRRTPYWQVCVEATCLPSGAIDLGSADLLFAALALCEGHTPDETCELLRAVTPCASRAADYCTQIVRQATDSPGLYVIAERATQYAEAHPFAWELGLC